MSDYDVVVIGGGPTGLATGNLATKAGKTAIVLEMNDRPGGLAQACEEIPGFVHNRGAYYTMFDDAKAIMDMHGIDPDTIEMIWPDELGISYGDPKLPPMLNYRDPARTMEHVGKYYGNEVLQGYIGYAQFMAPISAAMKIAMHNPPMSMAQIMDMMPSIEAKDALRKVFYGSIRDLVDEFIPYSEKSTVLRGLLFQNATGWFYGGPTDPGSVLAAAYLSGVTTDSIDLPLSVPKGGMGRLMEAAAEVFVNRGGELRCNTKVKKLIVREGKAVGVELEDGTEITGDIVVTSLDPGNMFGNCCDPEDLDPNFLKRVKQIHFDDSICQFYIALDRLPTLLDNFDMDLNKDARWFGQLVINDESLYEPNWYQVRHLHEVPDYLCCGGGAAFSTFDPSVAPEGKHTMTLCNNFTWPYTFPDMPDEKDVPAIKEKIKAAVIRSYGKVMPDFEECLHDIAIYTPYDYNKKYGVSGGNWTHGPLRITNMLNFRPMLGMSDYRGPLKNLYLCGSSNHPGPGVSSVSATNCWNAIKADQGWA